MNTYKKILNKIEPANRKILESSNNKKKILANYNSKEKNEKILNENQNNFYSKEIKYLKKNSVSNKEIYQTPKINVKFKMN